MRLLRTLSLSVAKVELYETPPWRGTALFFTLPPGLGCLGRLVLSLWLSQTFGLCYKATYNYKAKLCKSLCSCKCPNPLKGFHKLKVCAQIDD